MISCIAICDTLTPAIKILVECYLCRTVELSRRAAVGSSELL